MPKDPSLSKAAGILGRVKTSKKAASSAENGRKNVARNGYKWKSYHAKKRFLEEKKALAKKLEKDALEAKEDATQTGGQEGSGVAPGSR